MKLNLVALPTLLILLACICDVLCSYSVLWKLNGSGEEIIRAKQSSLMRSYMNLLADPCEDFYEYACGNWEHVHPIAEDQSENSVFTLLNDNIQNELREILLQPVLPNQELGAEDKARVYFAACMDEETINRRGAEPLLHFIDELGGWPVLNDSWSEEGFDWLQLAIKTSLLGYPNLLFFDVSENFKNLTQNAIYLEEPKLGAPNQADFFNSDNAKHVNAYRNLIFAVLRLLNIDLEKAKETAKEIVDFEIQLANLTAHDYTTQQLYNPTTIEDLSKNYSDIDWMTYFSAALEIPLQLNQSVLMFTSTSYYSSLARILKEVEPRTLANHMIWQSIHPFLDALDGNFRVALQDFTEVITEQKIFSARWKECLEAVNVDIGMATGAMFVRQYFSEDGKNEATDIMNNLKDVFGKALVELEWVDEETKAFVQNKILETNFAIGYPDFIQDPAKLNKLYSDLKVASGTHFENSVNLDKYSSGMRRKHVEESIDKELWPVTPAAVNFFFQQGYNVIGVPVGTLLPPMFHKHFPRALKYGATGVFIINEFAHFVAGNIKQLDSAGNKIRRMSPNIIKKFKERVNCFTKQYANFSLNGMLLPVPKKKGDNIVYHAVLRQAFKAYRKWENVNEKGNRDSSKVLPGLNLNNNQLFFLGFAQMWCSAIRPEAIENSMNRNAYTPGRFRVVGTLVNMEEFSEAFQCPAGSFMNPQENCRSL